ncbi:MAG: hypothetical protein ACYCUM_09530 [Solirubrobacteraceae bacterium]
MSEAIPDQLVVPYRELGYGGARPYLFVHVVGPLGQSRMIPGLIDSGADRSVLPAGFAPLLGYTRTDLVRVEGTQAAGSISMLQALTPSTAHVPELPSLVFEISPFFVNGCQQALWGRADLMRRFDVTISESRQLALLTPAA